MYHKGSEPSNPLTDSNHLLLELWPSPAELLNDEGNDLYLRGLQEFYASHKELEKQLRNMNVGFKWYTHLSVEKGREGDRAFPPEIVSFIVDLATFIGTSGIATSGVAIALYKLLDLWVKQVSGRQIKVKFGDVEVDATQLTSKQFEALIQKILQYKTNFEKRVKEEVKSNFPVTTTEKRDRDLALLRYLILHPESITQDKDENSTDANIEIGDRDFKLMITRQRLEDIMKVLRMLQRENQHLREEVSRLRRTGGWWKRKSK